MNTETENSVNEESPDNPENKSFGNTVLYFILLIIIILLSAEGFFFWQTIQNSRQTISDLHDSQKREISRNTVKLEAIESRLKNLEVQQRQQAELLDTFGKTERNTSRDWSLAEIEHLLIIALHQAMIEKNIETAITALQSADNRLKDMDNPGLYPVRQQIGKDINRLRSVHVADTSGMAIFIADMIGRVEDLPLRKPSVQKQHEQEEKHTSVEDQAGWSGTINKLLVKIWQDLKSMVVIKHRDQVNQVLLIPEQEYYLYQNLRLELGNARYAILRKDTENMLASILLIKEWINTYFDTSHIPTNNLLETLDQMQQIELSPELPDITSSLETLKAYMHTADDSNH